MESNRLVGRAVVALAVMVLGSGPVLAQGGIAPNWPDWLVKDMVKEALVREADAVSLAGQRFVGRVPGTVAEDPVENEDTWYFASDLGDVGLMECWVFTTEQDPATLTNQLSHAVIEGAAQDTTQPLDKQLYHLDAGHLQGRPYFALEWIYTVGTPPTAMIGLAKMRTAMIGDYTLSCSHNQLGYRVTFANLFKQLVSSVRVRNAGSEPYYQELFIQSVAGRPLGFSMETFRLDNEGDSEVVSVESILMPVDGSSLSSSDTWRKSFSNPDGTLINEYVYATENGDVVTDMALAWEGEQWQVQGSLMGKAFSDTIAADVVPVNSVAFFKGMRELLQDDQTNSLEYPIWLPSADPSSFMTTVVTLERPGNRGTMQMGPLLMEGEFGPQGTVEYMQMDMAGISLVLERAWHRGEIPGS